MAFSTIGWFGPECPFYNYIVYPDQLYDKMRIMPANLVTGFDFPLELAMKIFWEAQSFSVSSSLTTFNQGREFSSQFNYVAEWGSFDLAFNQFGNSRPTITRAKELLCIKKNPPPFSQYHGNLSFGSHTFVSKLELYTWEFGTWSAGSGIFLGPQMVIDPATNEMHFYFSVSHDHGGIISGPVGVTFGPNKATNRGVIVTDGPPVTMITPWGNYSCPMTMTQTVVDASMTVTVTAADPSVRYA